MGQGQDGHRATPRGWDRAERHQAPSPLSRQLWVCGEFSAWERGEPGEREEWTGSLSVSSADQQPGPPLPARPRPFQPRVALHSGCHPPELGRVLCEERIRSSVPPAGRVRRREHGDRGRLVTSLPGVFHWPRARAERQGGPSPEDAPAFATPREAPGHAAALCAPQSSWKSL